MKQFVRENISNILLIVVLGLALHFYMKADQEALCSNETTAYSGCSKK